MNRIDALIRSLGAEAPVEENALDTARRTLRVAIAAETGGGGARNRRLLLIALFAALALAGISVPAIGVANGWFGGGAEIEGIRGSAAPELTSRPVVVASGEPDEKWAIVIARSNEGLCLNVDVGEGRLLLSGNYRLGNCGYSDIRGHLPPDVRGDASAPCIGSSALVPCGSLPKYWVAVRSWGARLPETGRRIVAGAAAAEVASVGLVLSNGKTLRAKFVERPLGSDVPLNVYWAELGPCNAGNLVEEVVARDAEGNVLGRRVPAWNANPTGDQNGPRPPLDTESCT